MENPNIEEIKKAYYRYSYQKYRKPKYNENEEFRKKHIKQNCIWMKNKIDTDPEFAEKIRKINRDRYNNDEVYREKQKQRSKEQYARKKAALAN